MKFHMKKNKAQMNLNLPKSVSFAAVKKTNNIMKQLFLNCLKKKVQIPKQKYFLTKKKEIKEDFKTLNNLKERISQENQNKMIH